MIAHGIYNRFESSEKSGTVPCGVIAPRESVNVYSQKSEHCLCIARQNMFTRFFQGRFDETSIVLTLSYDLSLVMHAPLVKAFDTRVCTQGHHPIWETGVTRGVIRKLFIH